MCGVSRLRSRMALPRLGCGGRRKNASRGNLCTDGPSFFPILHTAVLFLCTDSGTVWLSIHKKQIVAAIYMILVLCVCHAGVFLWFFKLPLRARTTCRLGRHTRSFSYQFKVSSVSGSAEQLTLDNVNRMGDLMVIRRMDVWEVKKPTGKRSRKHPTFRFLLGQPKRHHTLTLSRGRLSRNVCARGKLSLSVSLCIGQNVHLP